MAVEDRADCDSSPSIGAQLSPVMERMSRSLIPGLPFAKSIVLSWCPSRSHDIDFRRHARHI